jgi:hypothetical protein
MGAGVAWLAWRGVAWRGVVWRRFAPESEKKVKKSLKVRLRLLSLALSKGQKEEGV